MCTSAARASPVTAAVVVHLGEKGGTMRWKGLLAFAAITLGLGLTWGAAPAAADAPPAYQDAHRSIEARVSDLLDRMTLAEKIGQMDQIVVSKLRDTTAPANGDC